MVFNKEITGIENEIEFVKYLNNKKVYELNPIFRELIFKLYGDIDVNSVVKCYKSTQPIKSDMFIVINSIKKGISIKKGVKNSVHVDRISDFIHFLITNGVKKDVIIEYLKYQYADGTTNGKGSYRMSSKEYKSFYQDKIDLINKAFNNPSLIKNAVKRFITMGHNSSYEIDALIYGVIEDFIWITKEDIYKVILSNKDIYSTGVHLGSLYCQPMDRCLNYNVKYESKRFCVQIKWYHLSDDIIKIMNDNFY